MVGNLVYDNDSIKNEKLEIKKNDNAEQDDKTTPR